MSLITSQKKLNTGDMAPDFSLKGVDGKMYRLSDFVEHEGLLVVFICNHCPYVIVKIEALKKLYDEFKDNIAIVAINSNDPEYMGEGMDKMRAFITKHNINFPYLMDDSQKVAKTYGAVCTPDPFLFNKERKLVFHGKINNAMNLDDVASKDTMKENIAKMLRKEKIENDFDPSQGCSIKWRT